MTSPYNNLPIIRSKLKPPKEKWEEIEISAYIDDESYHLSAREMPISLPYLLEKYLKIPEGDMMNEIEISVKIKIKARKGRIIIENI